MSLKKYEDVQREKVPPALPRTSSGVKCTEPKCNGEMTYVEPHLKHPELSGLQRAICEVCGWRGWA